MSAVLAAAAALLLQQQSPDHLRRWIDQLAEEDVSVRESASRRLGDAGRAAWPALEAASRTHPDPEARARARDLLAAARDRRRLSHRILEEHPGALGALTAGATCEKIRLIRTLGRYYDETSDLLRDFVLDPDPEIAVAAADALYENRNYEWVGRLLELYAAEECPRATRVYELLSSNASRLAAADLQRLFAGTGPRGRNRLMHLAINANLPLAVPPDMVRAMLRAGDAPARRAALAWVRDRGPQGNAFEIEPLLDETEPHLAADALATLRHLRHRPDPETLARLLRHEESLVREEAVHTTVAFAEREELPILRTLLDDPSTSVRQAALSGLFKLQGPAALEDALRVYLRDAGEQREQAAALLARHRDWSLPRVRKLAADPDPDRRLRALELLQQFDGPSVVAQAVGDAEEAIRRWALARQLKADTPATLEVLEMLSRDAAESIRFEALRSLVRRGRREHVPALRSFLDSREYTLRYEAAETILEHGGDACEPLARALLEDPDPSLRRLALNALAERQDAASARHAFECLNDPDGRLRRSAAQYLGQVLKHRPDPAMMARLAAAMDALEDEALVLAFNLVVTYGDPDAAPALRRLVASGRAPSLQRVVQALAEWAGDRAPAELVPLLGDDPALNELVFARARELRARFPESDRADLEKAVRRLLGHANRRIRRAALLAAEDLGVATDAIPCLVEDPEPSVSCAAIGACARLGLSAAARAVEARLDDPDPDVRVTAASAISRLRPEARAAVERAVRREECAWARRRMDDGLRHELR